MKKLVSLLLALLMVFSLFGCSAGQGETKDPVSEKPSQGEESATPAEPEDEFGVSTTAELNFEGGKRAVVLEDGVEYKKDIVLAFAQKHGTLDPQAAGSGIQYMMEMLSHNRLVHRNTVTNEFEPELATEWSVSEDGLTYTFKLRDDVKFHNGEAFTADDVLFTYERAVESGVATLPLTSLVSSVEVISDYEVAYHLINPNNDFVFFVAGDYSVVLNREAFDADPDTGWKIGTGGFVLDDFVPSESAHYTRFDESWIWADGLTPTETITFKIMTEDAARMMALESGEVDYAHQFPLDMIAEYSAKDGLDGNVMASESLDFLALSQDNELLKNDENLRKAIMYAFNPQDIMDVCDNSYGTIIHTMWGPNQYGFDESINEPIHYDLAKAQEYLKASNYNGEELRITTISSYQPRAEVLQANLLALGLNVKVDINEMAAIDQRAKEKDLDIFYFNMGLQPYGDYMRRIITPGGNANRGRYSNDEVTALLDKALTESDDATRKGYYKEVQQIVNDDAFLMPAFCICLAQAYNENISGIDFRADALHEFTYVVCAEK